MSDNEHPANPVNPVSPPSESGNLDWYLEALVNVADQVQDFTMAITLFVGGALVSGELVGAEKYFNGLADELRAAGVDAQFTDLLFTKFGEVYAKVREAKKQRPDDEALRHPGLIHLKNARIYHPGTTPIPTNRAVFWRGRLDAVDGFVVGKLSAGPTI